MATIRNTSPQLIHVTLASGPVLRLPPGQTSDELPDVEVKNNPNVDELQRRGTIEITRTSEETPAPAAEDTSADRARRRGSAGG